MKYMIIAFPQCVMLLMEDLYALLLNVFVDVILGK